MMILKSGTDNQINIHLQPSPNKASRAMCRADRKKERQLYDMGINHLGRGMCCYSTDSSDFAYPWKAFRAL